MNLSVVDHLSDPYWRAVELRREILRFPLGLDYSNDQLLAETDATHFVGEFEGKVVCYAMATNYSAEGSSVKVVQIRQVAVSQDQQGKGIGSQIMSFVETWAEGAGYSAVILHSRGYAVPFYQKIGYRGFGDEFVEVGIPHLKMKKQLVVPK